jgi:hypothetical protein
VQKWNTEERECANADRSYGFNGFGFDLEEDIYGACTTTKGVSLLLSFIVERKGRKRGKNKRRIKGK